MAAGEGRRLRPLTERFAKPVLPIGGRPVVAALLRELAAAGVERAVVVTGHLAEQVEGLLGDGTAFGLEVVYARQPRADGSADAVRRAVAAGARPPFVVTAADTVYSAGDCGVFVRAVAESGADGAMTARRRPAPEPGKPPVAIEDGLVRRVIDDDLSNPLSSAPLWAMGEALVPYLDGLPGPPFELALAFQRGIDDGLRVLGLEIGPTRDLTYPEDLVVHNFPYLAAHE